MTIAISGSSVNLRAEKDDRGGDRTYSVLATATDIAGDTDTAVGTCTVPNCRQAAPRSEASRRHRPRAPDPAKRTRRGA